MPKITFVNEHRTVDVVSGASVYAAAEAEAIALAVHRFRGTFHCGGRGVCKACVCWVEESAPGVGGPRSFLERLRGLDGWRRLSCRTAVTGDVRVFTMPAAGNRVGVLRPIAPAPTPTSDPSAPRKADDAASTAAYIHGHPAMIGRGVAPEPATAVEPPVAAPVAVGAERVPDGPRDPSLNGGAS